MTSAAVELDDFLSDASRRGGVEGVDSFGDPIAEYQALRESSGLVWRADQRAYRVGGDERVGFLQRLLTGNIERIAEGTSAISLLLDNKGRTQLDMEIGATPDELVVVGAAAQLDEGMAALSRYILRSDVAITPLDSAVLALAGPESDELVRVSELGTLATPPQVFRAVWGWLLIASAPVVVWQRLLAVGAVPVGLHAAEHARIVGGQAASGSEISGAEFPQELRLDAAIDFEKGCYLGQETVARIHYRGQVNRLLCVLGCDDMVQAGDTLLAGGKEVGQVTSVSGAVGSSVVALALVARDCSEVGTALMTNLGIPVAVAEAIDGQ